VYARTAAADPRAAARGDGGDRAALAGKLAEFWSSRVGSALAERGYAYDEVGAALGARGASLDPADVLRRAAAIQQRRGAADFLPLVVGFKRVANILKAATDAPAGVTGPLGESADPAEAALLAAVERAARDASPLFAGCEYERVLDLLLGLRAPIDAFF